MANSLSMVNAQDLDSLNAEQLRALAAELIAQAAQRERVISRACALE